MIFRKRNAWWIGATVLGLWLAALPILAAGQEEPVPEAGDEPEIAQPVAEETEAAVKLIKMYAEQWKWTPNMIRVPLGTRLRIEFLSYDATRRFDLKGYKLKVRIPQGKLTSVEFTADKKGEFKWRCGRPCGDGCAKMTGKLIVE